MARRVWRDGEDGGGSGDGGVRTRPRSTGRPRGGTSSAAGARENSKWDALGLVADDFLPQVVQHPHAQQHPATQRQLVRLEHEFTSNEPVNRSANHQEVNHQEVNHQEVNHQEVNHQEVNHQEVNHQEVNHQKVNHQEVNHQEVNHQEVNHQEVNHQKVNHQEVNHQEVNHQEVNHQEANHQEVIQEVNHQEVNHQENRRRTCCTEAEVDGSKTLQGETKWSGLQLASQSARGVCGGGARGFPFLPFLPRGTGVERPGEEKEEREKRGEEREKRGGGEREEGRRRDIHSDRGYPWALSWGLRGLDEGLLGSSSSLSSSENSNISSSLALLKCRVCFLTLGVSITSVFWRQGSPDPAGKCRFGFPRRRSWPADGESRLVSGESPDGVRRIEASERGRSHYLGEGGALALGLDGDGNFEPSSSSSIRAPYAPFLSRSSTSFLDNG
ncbi:hypothetical protein EYF80_029393 [Liparis tanakae]|uniref:Uncharacterized protein n=1 Tax=Liparis tanakae TaxID=230148 RepID=A0A4Z2H6I1_9TELE|nr:hypothetical protein EYF80_029393 [Liparis tanakae]